MKTCDNYQGQCCGNCHRSEMMISVELNGTKASLIPEEGTDEGLYAKVCCLKLNQCLAERDGVIQFPLSSNSIN